MSVVAQAGGRIVSVAIIAQLVSNIAIIPLAASRNPSADTASGGGTSVTPLARNQ